MRLFKNLRKKNTAETAKKAEPFKTDVKKLKLLITVVNRNKTEFYMDYLTSFDVNFQTSVLAEGTAKSDTLYLLGLEDSDKSVLFSIINEDKANDALRGLEEKFHTIRDGKGIAFTIPLTSVIGASIYRFLCNAKK